MTASDSGEGRKDATVLWTRRLSLACALLLAVTFSSGQARPPAETSPMAGALKALNMGQFDQVETLLRTSTDPQASAIRARANIERGRYAEAEKLLAGPAASAPGSDAALELGRLQLYLGRQAEGARTLQRLLATGAESTAPDLVRLGVAARALSQIKEANGYFQAAGAVAPDDLSLNIEWGELFLQTYNRPEALKSFQAALRADATSVRAGIGLARVAVDENPPAARAAIEKVLATNASYVPAHLLLAELALDDRRRADAHESIEKALKVNPNSLEARSLEAAIAFLEGRTTDFNSQVAEVLKTNPRYGEVYRVAGDHAARNYRFAEAVDLVRRALTVDPGSTQAYADLGSHLLRTGDEPGARRALETAFKADPYNVVTYNSLSLLDTLNTFVTITDGDIVMRLHPDEAAVMREYAMPLAKEALARYLTLYDFKPTGPILIEMFPKHDDFAVRTVGLPGMIGALGACFGQVVTLDSPKARPPGQFSWEATLWHELAHVITLQMSNNRVPRWLTEGISEREERRARPEWGREMEVRFAQALDAGKVMKLKDLNDGFTNPQLITLAYYEGGLLVEHLAATYGEPALRTLLRAYGRGLETDAALQEAYKTSMDEIQTSFDAMLETKYAAIRRALKTPDVPKDAGIEVLRALAQANPDSFALHMQLGDALREAKDADGAIREFERAAQLIPGATGKDNPNAYIASIALERKDTTRAIQALDALVKVDADDVEAARKLASLVAPLGDAARSAAAYERVVSLDPFDSDAETNVGRLALKRRDAPRAVRAFRAALATSPADQAAAHTDLAEAYHMAGESPQAKREALAALEIAPSFERAQDLLLKIVGSQASGSAN